MKKRLDKMLAVRELLESIYVDVEDYLPEGIETTTEAHRLQKTAILLVEEALMIYKQMLGGSQAATIMNRDKK